MKKLFRNIISILTVLVLLSATSGITIFHHICGMEGVHITSLFAKSSCNENSEACACCESSKHSDASCSWKDVSDCYEFVEYKAIANDYVSVEKLLLKVYEIENYILIFNINDNNNSQNSITNISDFCDISPPVQSEISFIHYISQSKNSELPADFS